MRIHNGTLMAALAAGALVSGCAGQAERPTAELTRAGTLIDQAEQVGAQRYAAAELEQARAKLDQANQAVEDGETERARRLAVEASLDAELAAARTRSIETQRAAREIQKSVEALRREAERAPPATEAVTPSTPDIMESPATAPGGSTTMSPDGPATTSEVETGRP